MIEILFTSKSSTISVCKTYSNPSQKLITFTSISNIPYKTLISKRRIREREKNLRRGSSENGSRIRITKAKRKTMEVVVFGVPEIETVGTVVSE